MSIILHQRTQQLLNELKCQLQVADMWSLRRPSDSELTSDAPFACDTLLFEQWLQFIFIEKMQDILDNDLSLPDTMCLLPMAQESFKQRNNCKPILIILEKIDSLYSNEQSQ